MMTPLIAAWGPFDVPFLDSFKACSLVHDALLPFSFLIFLIAWILAMSRKKHELNETFRLVIFTSILLVFMLAMWDIIAYTGATMAEASPSTSQTMVKEFQTMDRSLNNGMKEGNFIAKKRDGLSLWSSLNEVLQSLMVEMAAAGFQEVSALNLMFMKCLAVFKWFVLMLMWSFSPMMIPLLLIDELKSIVHKYLTVIVSVMIWPMVSMFIDMLIYCIFKFIMYIYCDGIRASAKDFKVILDDQPVDNGMFDTTARPVAEGVIKLVETGSSLLGILVLFLLITFIVVFSLILHCFIPVIATAVVSGGNPISPVTGAIADAVKAGAKMMIQAKTGGATGGAKTGGAA